MDSVKTNQVRRSKKRLVRTVAIVCALITVFGVASLALSQLLSKNIPSSGQFDSIYIDGTKVVEYHGAQYSVDENGNVWEESPEEIRLVTKKAGARLLAVYDDSLWILTEGGGEYYVSRLSPASGKLSNGISLGRTPVTSFSMTDDGVYYMAGRRIMLASDKTSKPALDLSSLVYECEKEHSHDCEDEALPANAEFFSVHDENSLLLYSANPAYIDETEEEADDIGENSKYISFLYDIEKKTVSRFNENDSDGSGVSLLATTNPIKVNGVTVPFAEYPAGSSYFTKNGKACTCHNRNQCLANSYPCNCLRYVKINGKTVDLLSTQCMGFARYCQYRIFGYHDKASSSKFTNALGGGWSAGTFTASDLQRVLLEFGEGGHFRTNGHSLFVISVDATGFITYECNTNNKDCLVYTRTWTWAYFYNYTKTKGINYYKMPTAYKNSVDVVYPTGEYLIEAEGGLRLREKPTTSSTALTKIPDATRITITETVKIDGASENVWWGKTTYNGYTGWISLDYAKLSSNIKSIQIVKMPNRVTFNENEKFSYDGLQIQLNYENGTSSNALSSGFTVKAPSMTPGEHTVTISCQGFTVTYKITVKNVIVLPEQIVFDRPTITVMTGGEFIPAVGIDYKVLPADAHDKTVEWSVVSGEHLVSVNKTTGVVTAVKASSSFEDGYATIRATSLAEDAKGNRVSVYNEYVVEVIKASSDGEWSQAASSIPDGVSVADYVIEYCATQSDFNKGNWKKYDGSASVKAYKYRFKNAYKLTWYYDLDNSDGNIELPSSFGYPSSVMIDERIYVSRLKAVTQTNRLFAGWFTSADGAKNLDMKYAYTGNEITSDTEFFAGWLDLSDENYLVNAAENDPVHSAGKSLPAFGVFGSDINISNEDGGLRFYAHISTALTEKLESLSSRKVEYGMVVQLANNVGSELRSSTGNGYIQQGHSIVVDANLNYGEYQFMSGSSYTVFTTLATNIPLENAKTEIAARAFIVYYDANGIRRAFYFTNTEENTESLSLVGRGVKTCLYEQAEKLFDGASEEEKSWLLENVLGHDYE